MSKIKTLKALSPEDLPEVAKAIIEDMKEFHIFALYGKMGAGKTTLVKAFAKALGSTDVVSSPTFSLVNEYNDGQGISFYHFDFYRIKHLEEVFDIGFEEYIYSGKYCFLEWPGHILELLPKTYVYISIEVNEGEGRLISYRIHTFNE